jgi:hypothetical protein
VEGGGRERVENEEEEEEVEDEEVESSGEEVDGFVRTTYAGDLRQSEREEGGERGREREGERERERERQRASVGDDGEGERVGVEGGRGRGGGGGGGGGEGAGIAGDVYRVPGLSNMYSVYIPLFPHAVPEGVLRWAMSGPLWHLSSSAALLHITYYTGAVPPACTAFGFRLRGLALLLGFRYPPLLRCPLVLL